MVDSTANTDNITASDRRHTTIQVTNEIWAALDRRKESGESFDSVIRRLIEATGVGVGALAGEPPDVIFGDVEPLTDDADTPGCAHFDVIEGETCPNDPQFRQEYHYANSDERNEFYYCGEHAPAGP